MTLTSGARAPCKLMFYKSQTLKDVLQKSAKDDLQKLGARAGKTKVLGGLRPSTKYSGRTVINGKIFKSWRLPVEFFSQISNLDGGLAEEHS